MSLTQGKEDGSYYSSIYKEDVHIERSGGSFFISKSDGTPIGPLGGFMCSDRSLVEKQMRDKY